VIADVTFVPPKFFTMAAWSSALPASASIARIEEN